MSSNPQNYQNHDNLKIIISGDFVDYQVAIKAMDERKKSTINGNSCEFFWLLEHNHLYTGGSSANNQQHISKIPNNVPLHYQSRGGQFTYHGPGQRIGYFCLDLKKRQKTLDLHKVINLIEEIVILSLKKLYNINSSRIDGKTGVWVENQEKFEKICAIGVNCGKGILTHGFALNICNNLDYFKLITPCGIVDDEKFGVCSVSSILKKEITVYDLDNLLVDFFKEIFLKNL